MGGRLGASRLGAFTLGAPEGPSGGMAPAATAEATADAFAGTPPVFVPPTLPGATAVAIAAALAGTPLDYDPATAIPAGAEPAEAFAAVAFAGTPNLSIEPSTGLLGCLQRDYQRPLLKVRMGGHWELASPGNSGTITGSVWTPPFPGVQTGDLVLLDDPLPVFEPDTISASVTWAIDRGGPRVAEASVTLASDLPEMDSAALHSYHPYLPIQVWMGYRDEDGLEQWDVTFSGWVQADDEKGWPKTNQVKAAGFLSAAQRPVSKNFSWGKGASKSGSERAFVRYMLELSGFSTWSMTVHGSDDAKIGQKRTVKIAPRWSALDIIAQLDSLTLYYTRDGKYGRIVRDAIPVREEDAEANVIASFSDGDPTLPVLPILSLESTRSTQQTINRVAVFGLLPDDKDDGRSYYARHDDISPWVQKLSTVGLPSGLRTAAEIIESDWVETDAHAVETCYAHMRAGDKPQREYSMTVAGNPFLIPGKCVRVTYADLHLDDEVCVIYGVSHDAADARWITTVRLAAGFGRTGHRLKLSPTARITVQDVVDEGDGYKHVYVTGSWSGDPDTDYMLNYHWFNSHTPYELEGEEKREYDVIFTPEEWATGPIIKLVVENTYGLTDYAEVSV